MVLPSFCMLKALYKGKKSSSNRSVVTGQVSLTVCACFATLSGEVLQTELGWGQTVSKLRSDL